MKKIKAALAHLATRLSTRKGSLARARRRHKKFRLLAERETALGKAAADYQQTEKAKRHYGRAASRQKKAIHWKGVIKEDLAAIHGLEDRIEKRTAELAQWTKEHGVTFEGENRVVGGTGDQRLFAAATKTMANYRAGTQPGYYSQTGGARDYDHAINHYAPDRVWDCSTYLDGQYLCCGLTAPSGPNTRTTGGWTGPQGEHGKRIRKSEARAGDLVLYGPAPHHHVEEVYEPEHEVTSGHGSAPVDPGIYDLFGGGRCIEGVESLVDFDDYEIRRYF